MGGYNNWSDNWSGDDVIDLVNYIRKFPDQPDHESYQTKVERLAKTYPAIAEAKAHLDALVIMVEHGE
jgi:hypothetical protein